MKKKTTSSRKVIPQRVGDRVHNGEQAARLPAGTVLVEMVENPTSWVKTKEGWFQSFTLAKGELRGVNGLPDKVVTVDAAHVPLIIAFLPETSGKVQNKDKDVDVEANVPLAQCPFCGGTAQEMRTSVSDMLRVVEQRTVGCWAQWCSVQPKVTVQAPLSARAAWNYRKAP